MTLRHSLGALLLVAGLLPGAALAETLTVQSRRAVEVPLAPARVVVLDSTANDTLRALGVRPVGIPRSGFDAAFTEWQGEAGADIVDVTKERGIDVEKVAGLKPDLIITGWRNSVTPELEAIAPTIDLSPVFGKAGHLATLRDNLQVFGKIFGKEPEAEALLGRLDAGIARARAGFAQTGPGLMLTSSNGKLHPAAPGSRYGAFYDTLWLVPSQLPPAPQVTATEGRPAPRELTPAQLAEINPGFVIVFDRGAVFGKPGDFTPAQEIFKDPALANADFLRNDRIVFLNPQEMYLAEGVVAYQNAIDLIVSKLP